MVSRLSTMGGIGKRNTHALHTQEEAMKPQRPKPIFADYFIYDNDDTMEHNFIRYCEAQPRWRNDCEQWREEHCTHSPAVIDTPFQVDTHRLGRYTTYLEGLFLGRAEVVAIILFFTVFYIFWW